jgi:GntR family transcriptional regulator
VTLATVDLVDVGGIDRSSGLPPYRELARRLRQQIISGQLRGRLPSEVDLAAQYRVGKGTARKALAILREEGLIETFHGYGSRVLEPEERQRP